MRIMDRREFLKLCSLTTPALAIPSYGRALLNPPSTVTAPKSILRTPKTLDRYIDPLPVPAKLKPIGKSKGAPQYHVRMLEVWQKLHSQLPPTKLWGYEGKYPGPTIEAWRNQAITVRWENQLPMRHLFEVNARNDSAMLAHQLRLSHSAPQVRAVTHLHGGRNMSQNDGLPENWYASGDSATFHYPNEQQATTLWYHDHALAITRLNVYAGLAGFYLLRDEQEQKLNLPSGRYEIPLVLQDRTLDEQGQLVYSPTDETGEKTAPGVWGPEFFGELPVINGAIYPYLEVEPRRYRLRVLNGANGRFFDLLFNLAKSVYSFPQPVRFLQIGSDGGLLPSPVPLSNLLLAPAERGDLIIDFSSLKGKTITLCNTAAAPFPGWEARKIHPAALNEVMQIRVTLPLSKEDEGFSDAWSLPFARLEPTTATRTRDFVLREDLDESGRSHGMKINGKGYDEPVTERVKLGSVEKWRFINLTDDTHPMHLHLVQFQIVERQGFDIPKFRQGELQLLGKPRVPTANEAGWKDTVRVNPGEVVTIIVRFEGYAGRYVYHCHVLEHEDNDMMRPYEVVE
jgi:spore coat protein A